METASDEMVMGAVPSFYLFSLLVNQQNHSGLSLTALDDGLKHLYKKKGAFRDQKMSQSAKALGNKLFSMESHQLREPMIHKIRAAMESRVYWTEKVTSSR